MSADLILHRLSFGGVAFEPATDAGADWLWGYAENLGGPPFTNEDACMAFFESDAIGFEPHDLEQVCTDAILAGIIMEAAKC